MNNAQEKLQTFAETSTKIHPVHETDMIRFSLRKSFEFNRETSSVN